MSYVKCPDCDKEIKVFGDSHIEKIAEEYGLEVLSKIPLDPNIASVCDKGLVELFEGDFMEGIADKLEK
jgi:MinD superfamily P-loop ATPase